MCCSVSVGGADDLHYCVRFGKDAYKGRNAYRLTFKIRKDIFVPPMGDCVMVARQILDLLVRVRILLPQNVLFVALQ